MPDFLDYLIRHDFNPWWGCTKVSPGCDHCFAENQARRRGHRVWGNNAPRRLMSDDYWRQPYLWNRAAHKEGERWRIFCGNMCDVMDIGSSTDIESQRQRLWPVIADCQMLNWMLLTRRPQEFKKRLPTSWLQSPLDNVYLLTTVESSDYLWRAKAILDTPATIRGIVCEPLLSRIDPPQAFLDLGRRAWIIAGTERTVSGGRGRVADITWVRHLRDCAVEAGVPFFFNQWGDFGPNSSGLTQIAYPPPHQSKRLIDGQMWNQVPPDIYGGMEL